MVVVAGKVAVVVVGVGWGLVGGKRGQSAMEEVLEE